MRWQVSLLIGSILVALIGVMALPPIPQDPAYHQFADVRTLLGVPNFWNVASNLFFPVVGAVGLLALRTERPVILRAGFTVFCVSIIAVGAGSAWYHLAPSIASLVWDRLPMSIAFMTLVCAVVGERISTRAASWALAPLSLLGAASVLYWYASELQGSGDLRAYGLVQFLPMLLLPLMLLLLPGNRAAANYLWCTFGLYLLAKLAEYFDGMLLNACGLSGHSLKHVLSAAAVFFAVRAWQQMAAR